MRLIKPILLFSNFFVLVGYIIVGDDKACRLTTYMGIPVHIANADHVLGGDYFCIVFFQGVFWIGSGVEYCQILTIFLLTFERIYSKVTGLKIPQLSPCYQPSVSRKQVNQNQH